MLEPVSTVRSFVNTWQCDENEHLNVQFFTAFAHDASAQLHARLGLGPAALRTAGLCIAPVEEHVRYYRELRVEDTVEVRSAPVAVAAASLTAYHEIRNAYDGIVAATVRCVTACRNAAGVAVAWPAAFRDRAGAGAVTLPAAAAPRSVGRHGPLPDLTLAAAAANPALHEISRSQVMPAECGADGRMAPRFHLARFSDGGAHLWHALGFDRAGMREREQGSVIMEAGLTYGERLPAGSLCVVLSGLLDMTDKAMHFAHFLFDAETGVLSARSEAVAVFFDQKARRTMAFSAADRARLAHRRLSFAP